MMRKTIAIFFLVTMGCGLFFWSQIKTNTLSTLIALIETIETNASQSSFDDAQNTLNEIDEVFSKNSRWFEISSHHDFSNSVSDCIGQIQAAIDNKDKYHLEEGISSLKSLISDFKKDNSIKLSNIL